MSDSVIQKEKNKKKQLLCNETESNERRKKTVFIFEKWVTFFIVRTNGQ